MKSSEQKKIKMAFLRAVMKEQKPNKISDELTHDFKYIDNDTQDQRNLIEENNEHELIEESSYKMKIVWPSAIAFLLMHLVTLYSFYLFFFRARFLTVLFVTSLVYLTGLSVTVGAHRLYSHRSFKVNKYIRFFVVLIFTMSGQKTLWRWVKNHRTHHKYSDTNADPHNSNRGFFFSHIGWLMVRKHSDVIRKGKTIDMSDLEQDPIVMFQKNHFLEIFFVVSVVLPTVIPYLCWNESIWNSFFINFVGRTTYVWNSTWLINSAAHLYGNRPYTKDIAPGENPLVSILTLGEGMHNYHHTFPWDYRASEYINLSTKVINYWMKKGWVYEAKTASPELVKRQTMKNGDGTHPVYNTMNPNGVPIGENY